VTADEAFERGVAHLQSGDVGLATVAYREALTLDPEHGAARGQLAAALEALGDDDGAARELQELIARAGPQPVLVTRLRGLREAAARAAGRALLGAPLARLPDSPLVSPAFVQGMGGIWRAPFGELLVSAGRRGIERMTLMFASMEASLARTDLAYGGTTEDEQGRRVPLDEFTAASVVFLAQALGVETERARRLLRFLLAKEYGLETRTFAGAQVGWAIEEDPRRYGLFASHRAQGPNL
jgi:tetratricopeptide (TPR) repeat protein